METLHIILIGIGAAMTQAGIAAWRNDGGLPISLLVMDEAADFARTPAIKTLIKVTRKAYAFRIPTASLGGILTYG